VKCIFQGILFCVRACLCVCVCVCVCVSVPAHVFMVYTHVTCFECTDSGCVAIVTDALQQVAVVVEALLAVALVARLGVDAAALLTDLIGEENAFVDICGCPRTRNTHTTPYRPPGDRTPTALPTTPYRPPGDRHPQPCPQQLIDHLVTDTHSPAHNTL